MLPSSWNICLYITYDIKLTKMDIERIVMYSSSTRPNIVFLFRKDLLNMRNHSLFSENIKNTFLVALSSHSLENGGLSSIKN